MRDDVHQRVAAELHRIRRTLRAFEDAARAEQDRQLARQRGARGAELREALTLAEEQRGQVVGLIVAQEIVAQRLGEITAEFRRARLNLPAPPT